MGEIFVSLIYLYKLMEVKHMTGGILCLACRCQFIDVFMKFIHAEVCRCSHVRISSLNKPVLEIIIELGEK